MPEKAQKHKYIFPNFLAEIMSKVDMRTQYEASMLSMSFICIGLVVSVIYVFFYTSFAMWYKIFLIVNGIAGLIFLSSFIVTTYQQYLTYMDAISFQKSMKGGSEKDGVSKKEKES